MNEFSSPQEYYSWTQIELLVKKVVNNILSSNKRYDIILGVANGGIIPARLIARDLDINHILFMPIRSKKLHNQEMPPLLESQKYLVVDDIYDTGYTYSAVYSELRKFVCDFAFLVRRFADNDVFDNDEKVYVGKVLNHKRWIVFPWERKRIENSRT